MVRGDDDLGNGGQGGELRLEAREALFEERVVAAVELDELAVVPAGDELARLGRDVVGRSVKIGSAEVFGGGGGDFGLVEASRDREALGGAGVGAPADRADDRGGWGPAGPALEPLP